MIFYTKNTNKPYSGDVFSLYDDGKKRDEGGLKNGREDGVWTYWHENGQTRSKGNYRMATNTENGHTIMRMIQRRTKQILMPL